MESQENNMQQIQMLEQNMQNLQMQKQAFQMELAETDSATEELENSGEEVFKLIGQLMIKSDKSKIKEEISNKKKMLELRIKTFEKQEISFAKQLEEIRERFLKTSKK